MANAAEIAQTYIARGCSVIPIPTKRKCPVLKGWTGLRLTVGDVASHFERNPMNIGVLLGEASCELVDVDLDCPEACDIAPAILPGTNSVFGRQSKPTSHYLYRCPISSQRFKDPETGEMLLEIRSTGHQTIFPGSIHPSGEAVEWYEDGPVADIEPLALLRAASQLAAASLLARHFPKEGGRHDAQLTVCAFLIRSGWSEEKTAAFVSSVVGANGGEADYEKRLSTAQDAVRRRSDGQSIRGWTAFCELFGEKVAQRASEWLGLASSSSKSAKRVEAALGSRKHSQTWL